MQQRYRFPFLAIGFMAVVVLCVLLTKKTSERVSHHYVDNDKSLLKDVLQEEDNQQKKEYFVIVSAVSSNHFIEAKDMIGSAQKYLPTRRIVMYDLGLKEDQRKELEGLCNVEVRTFDFDQYPPHFKSLSKYAWKPVIIRTLAHEAEYLFWSDASVRFSKDFETSLSKLDKFPIKGHHHDFDIIQVTHTDTLEYFNMTRESMRNVSGIEGGLVLYKTNEVTMHILDLWCDCAMHEECIAPKTAILIPCKFNLVKKGSIQYAGCHRYDQSVLNVILVREYGPEVYKEILDSGVETSLKVIRHPSHEYTVTKC